MRNLKKVLALTLAIALVLSLSVTAGAAKFTDSEEITAKYQDAVDLMSELSIMNGFPDQTYQPQGELTRAQYLKMLYVVMNRGVDDKAVLYAETQPFPFYDVRSSDWHNGYVRWGYGRELIDGYGGGIFKPNGTVTGFEALKMSLTALGYRSDIELYTGEAWKTNVLNDAQDAGLLLNLETENMSAILPREAAAQMLNNTLFAQTVQYNTSYIPPKFEKTGTMASTYYNLKVLTAVALANSWASLSGPTQQPGYSTFLVRYVDNNLPTGNAQWGTVTIPCDVPVELLGYEVILYARARVAPESTGYVGIYDKIYGSISKTKQNSTFTAYAEDNVTTISAWNSGYSAGAKDMLWYLTSAYDSDRNSKGANLDGRTYINYASKGVGTNHDLKQGSPINFIDNNNDGYYEYAIGLSMSYAKVTNIADDGKITAVSGSINSKAFDGTAVLSAVAPANIYLGLYEDSEDERSEALKVDDRVLVYALGSKYAVVPVGVTKGTLTATNGVGGRDAIATISGTTYENNLFRSAVSNLEGSAVTANYGVEKDWRFFGGFLLEAPNIAGVSQKWAVVLDSYAQGVSGFTTFSAQVKLLMEDGTTAAYNLGNVYYRNTSASNWSSRGLRATATATGKVAVTTNPGVSSSTPAMYQLDDVFATPTTVTLNSKNLFRAAVSADGKSVDLYEPINYDAASPVAGEYVDAGFASHKYTKGNSYLTVTAANATKNILNNTPFFILRPDTQKAGVYTGRSLPSFGAGSIDEAHIVYANIDGGQANSSGGYLGAVLYVTDNIDVLSRSGKYALVVSEPKVIFDEASGKYYAEIETFNGTETKTNATILGLRSITGNYSKDLISTTLWEGLGPVGNLGIVNGDVIEFELNAEGKYTRLVTLKRFAPGFNMAGTATTAAGREDGLYDGYYTIGGQGWVNYWRNNGNVTTDNRGTMTQDVDALFYNMTDKVGTSAGTWPSAPTYAARKAKLLVVDGHVIRVWADSKAAGWDTTGAAPTTTAELDVLKGNTTWVRVGSAAAVLAAGEWFYNNGKLTIANLYGVVSTIDVAGAWKNFFETLWNTNGTFATGTSTEDGLIVGVIVNSGSGGINVTLDSSIVGETLTATPDSFNSVITLSGSANNVVLVRNAGSYNVSGLNANIIARGAGNTINSITAGTRNLTIDGVGGANTVTTIVSAGTITVNPGALANAITIGTVTTASGINVVSGSNAGGTIDFTGAVTVTGALSVTGGTAAAAKVTFQDEVEAASITVDGSANDIEFADAIDVAGTVIVNGATGTAGQIDFDVVDATGLTITANYADINFNNTVDVTNQGSIVVTTIAGKVDFTDTVDAKSINATAGILATGDIDFDANIIASTVTLAAGGVATSDITVTGDIGDATNGAVVSITSGAGDVVCVTNEIFGSVTVNAGIGAGSVTLLDVSKYNTTVGGNVIVNGGTLINLNGAVANDVTVNGGIVASNASGTIANNLNVGANAGNVTVGAAITGNVTVATNYNATLALGASHVTSGKLTISGTLRTTGSITLVPGASPFVINITGATTCASDATAAAATYGVATAAGTVTLSDAASGNAGAVARVNVTDGATAIVSIAVAANGGGTTLQGVTISTAL